MPWYRATVRRTVWLDVDIEADDEQDARDRAACGQFESERPADGGRGLGDDDYEVITIERDEDDEDDDHD